MYSDKILFVLKNRVFPVCLIWINSFLFNSCGRFTKDEHPEYFQPIITKLEATDIAHKESLIVYMDSAFYAFPDPGPIDKIERLKIKGNFYFQAKKDYGKALLCIDSILQLTEGRLNNERFALYRTKGLYNKGEIYMALKNYDEALHYYVLSKQTGAEYIKGDCSYLSYSGIADLLYRQGKFLLAAHQYLENYASEERCNKDRVLRFAYMQGNLNSAASSYELAGKLDSARFYYDSALHFIASNEKNYPDKKEYINLAKAVIYYGQGNVMEKTNQPEAAKSVYLKSIEGTKNDYEEFTQSTRLALAKVYITTNEPEKADQVLQELKTTIFKQQNDHLTQLYYKLQSDYYLKTNNKEVALNYLQKYFAVRDSIEKADKKFTSMDVSREFENREQKAINQSLKNENEIKSFQLASALLLSLLAIVVVLFVWYNLKRSARHVKELENLNGEILLKNDDLRTAFVSLEQSQAENTKITRMVAHDLKNPIGGIRSLVLSLLKKDQPTEMEEILTLMEGACANSISLINDLLNEKKELNDIRKEMVDLSRLLKYCVDLLQAKADEKNQWLQLEMDTVLILLNRQKMWRVISNIIQNAIKFSPENATINVKLEHKEDTVLLTVEDQGIGIPQDLKDKIFALDPVASRVGTAGEESHGLGLSISRKIIEEHNGKLWFESEAGKGCTFYVELPCAN